jgi:hypothetical protein
MRCTTALLFLAAVTLAGSAMAQSPVSSPADSLLTASLPNTFTTMQPIYLYGERYSPPHIVEWTGQTLYCHGVQIAPRLREPVAAPSAAAISRFALDQRADSCAAATGASAKSRQALEAMREIYAASELVQRAWFDDDGKLWVKFWASQYPVGIRTVDATREGLAPADPNADAADLYKLLVNAFRWNRRVFIGSDYVSVIAHVGEADSQLQALQQGRTTDGPLPQEVLRDIAEKEGRR